MVNGVAREAEEERRAERGGRPRGIKREREVDEIGNTSEREDETRSEK